MDAERYQALKEEVDKLISCDFIKESFYPSSLANPVLVRKPNDKWRTCVDFTDLNKVCSKDSFPAEDRPAGGYNLRTCIAELHGRLFGI